MQIRNIVVLSALVLSACSSQVQESSKLVPSTSVSVVPSQGVTVPGTKKVTHLSIPKDKLVFINGEILDMTNVVNQVKKLGETGEPFYVYLNSPGGSVLSGSAVISAIESSKGPVYTVCDSICASMAALIFEYGTKRYIVDRSFLMFHPATGGAEGEIDKATSRLLTIQRYIGKLENFVATRAGISFEQYKVLASRELWLDGEDAVNNHFADELASLYFPDVTMNQEVTTYGVHKNNLDQYIKLNPMITAYPNVGNTLGN